MGRWDRRGGGWSTNKLVMFILFAVILVLIVVGAIGGGLNPLIDELKEEFGNAMVKIGLASKRVAHDSKTCEDWDDIVGLGKFRICEGYCEIRTDDSNRYTSTPGENPRIQQNGVDVTELKDFDEEMKKRVERVFSSDIYSAKLDEDLDLAREIYQETYNRHKKSQKISVYVGQGLISIDIIEENYDVRSSSSAKNVIYSSDDAMRKYLLDPLKDDASIEVSGENNMWLRLEYLLEELQEIKDAYEYFEKECV